jgi:hypothetical protein
MGNQLIPFGSREEAYRNASTLGYFNSAQAIADYAEIIIHLKKILHAEYSPVVVTGGSYGGKYVRDILLLYIFFNLIACKLMYESPYGRDALQITYFTTPTYQVPHHHFKRNAKNKNEHKHTKSK